MFGVNIVKKVGIVGGIGPASTLDYYRGIVDGCRTKAKDGSYPKIVINSIDMMEMLAYVSTKDWESLVNRRLGAVKDLERAGAEFAAIASNTPHIVFDEVKRRSALPLISIVESTCQYAASKGCSKVVVLGTRFTMSSGLYARAFEKYGIQAVTPAANEQNEVHNIIFPKLEDGIVVPEDKESMLAIAGRLIAEHHADALVLGCTELPLMVKDQDLDTLILNTTKIHIESIIQAM